MLYNIVNTPKTFETFMIVIIYILTYSCVYAPDKYYFFSVSYVEVVRKKIHIIDGADENLWFLI